MKSNNGETAAFPDRLRRQKSCEVSSRYLLPSSTSSTAENQIPSPLLQKHRSSIHSPNRPSLEESGFMHGLWPSSTNTPKSSGKKLDTLADHLGNERLDEISNGRRRNDDSMTILNRQRSCTVFDRFDNGRKTNGKESTQSRQFFGGSMRYTEKFKLLGKSSSSKSNSQALAHQDQNDHDDDHNNILAGRFSVDENALRWKSIRKRSESSSSDTPDSTVSSRKKDIEVSSKYMLDLSSSSRARSRSWSSATNSSIQKLQPVPSSPDSSLMKSVPKNHTLKKSSSLTMYKNITSKWASSPDRSGSPPVPVVAENMGKPMACSNLKPPSSPSRAKGVGNLVSMGLGIFKSKKHSSHNTPAAAPSSPIGLQGMAAESVHQLRLLHNRLVQWRYANASAEAVTRNVNSQAGGNLLFAWNGLTRLQNSVSLKKIQLEKEKLEMRLHFLLHSQMKQLQAWGDIESQHQTAISRTNNCLHSVVCRVPLIEGAEVELQSASVALRHALELSATIKSMISTFSSVTTKTALMLSELAEVVAQENYLLEEFLELFKIISTLAVHEQSLKCNVIQLELWQNELQQQIPA